MASVKILLYKSKQNSKGQHPIALRITKDRIPKYKFLEYVYPKQWNDEKGEVRKSHLNYKKINGLIENERMRAKNLILDYETKDRKFTAGQIMMTLKSSRSGSTFSVIAAEYIENKKSLNKLTGLTSDISRIKKFRNFLPSGDIHFENITESLLKRYVVHMKANGLKSKTSRANALSIIRAIFNVAIEEGIVDSKYYPFGPNKIVIRQGETKKIGLNVDEMKRIENLQLMEGSPVWHAKNVFLFSFYLAGIRIKDNICMKWNDIVDGRLYYKMGKNDKLVSLELPTKALEILKLYEKDKSNSSDFIFPEMRNANMKDVEDIERKVMAARVKFNFYLKKIAKLAKIEKTISNHISRHSFGNIAGGEIPLKSLQHLYRHGHESTTSNYQSNFDHTKTDEALNNVLDF